MNTLDIVKSLHDRLAHLETIWEKAGPTQDELDDGDRVPIVHVNKDRSLVNINSDEEELRYYDMIDKGKAFFRKHQDLQRHKQTDHHNQQYRAMIENGKKYFRVHQPSYSIDQYSYSTPSRRDHYSYSTPSRDNQSSYSVPSRRDHYSYSTPSRDNQYSYSVPSNRNQYSKSMPSRDDQFRNYPNRF